MAKNSAVLMHSVRQYIQRLLLDQSLGERKVNVVDRG
jgi:hypothetical protein